MPSEVNLIGLARIDPEVRRLLAGRCNRGDAALDRDGGHHDERFHSPYGAFFTCGGEPGRRGGRLWPRDSTSCPGADAGPHWRCQARANLIVYMDARFNGDFKTDCQGERHAFI